MTGLWFRSNDPGNLAEALRRFGQADVDAISRATYDSYWSDPPTLDRHIDAITAIYGNLVEAETGTSSALSA